MNKLKKWLYLLIWMLIIFIFSNQPHSGTTTHNLIEQTIPFLTNNNIIDIINFIIRKSAHLTEYIILTLLTISLLKEYTKKEIIILLTSILFCFLYAVTDEYHQSLVPGRSSLFKDVLIDTTGGLIATIIYIVKRKKLHHN